MTVPRDMKLRAKSRWPASRLLWPEIFFRPDTSKGNSGPGAVTRARNGAYQTREGKGVTSGPHVVEIVAFDGIPSASSDDGEPLTTKIYSTTVTLPAEDSTQDFDVPASHLVK